MSSSRRNGSVSRAAETASKSRLHMDRNPGHARITDPAHPAGRRKEIDNVMKRARQGSPGTWDRKLIEVEEKDPNRWRHSGYKQMYLNGSKSPSPRRSRSPPPGRRISRSPPPGKRVSRSPLPGRRLSRSPLHARRASRSPLPGRRVSRSPMPTRRMSRSPIPRRSRSPMLSRARPSPPRRRRSRSPRRQPSPRQVGAAGSTRRPPPPRRPRAAPAPPRRPPSPPPKSSGSGSSVSSCSDESCSVCSAKNKKSAPPSKTKPRSSPPPPPARAVKPTRELLQARDQGKRSREEKVLEWQRSQLGVAGTAGTAPAPPGPVGAVGAVAVKREGQRAPPSAALVHAALASSDSDSSDDNTPTRMTLSERFGKMAQWSQDRGATLQNMRITRRDAALHVAIQHDGRPDKPGGMSPAPVGSYPEELLAAAPTDTPAWDDVRVRYHYYKQRGYLRGLTLGDYVKWEEWWYKYQEWLKRERAYERWAEGEVSGSTRRERRRRGGRHRRS